MRRGEPELPRAVRVEEVGREHAVLHEHGAPRREPLAVEGARAERAGDRAVVHDRHRGGRHLGAEAIEQERGAPVEARAARRPRERAHEARRGLGVEDDGHLGGPHLPRAETPERAGRGGAAHRRRVLELRARARGRVPVVALHLAVLHGDRRRAEAERRARVAPHEAVRRRVGVARAPVRVLGALGVRDARVGRERGRLAGARDRDPRLGRRLRGAPVLEPEVGHLPDQLGRVGQPRVRVLGGRARQARRLVHHALERRAREVRGGRRGGGSAHEDAEGQALLPRVGHGLDLAEAHRGAPMAVLDEVAVGRGRAARGGARQHPDEHLRLHCSGVREAGAPVGGLRQVRAGFIPPCRRRSCRRCGAWATRRRPARTGRPCRTSPRPRRGRGRARRA